MARVREGCDCGCNDPVARNPKDMLVFLARRFDHAGVAESVASIYAYDIKLILKEHFVQNLLVNKYCKLHLASLQVLNNFHQKVYF